MSKQANVRSLESVRNFRHELNEFTHVMAQIVEELVHSCQQGVDWMETDRMSHWPAQVRRSSDQLAEARVNLERCQMTIRPGERAPCTEEKKALEQAVERLRLCEEKVRITRHWLQVVRHEADDFRTALAKTTHMADVDLPLALTRLDEIIVKLEAYV
ncbi:MAG: hypothetical protein O2931_02165 [Planctomycetota bacterium]|nr:hypothetical protein [Planctomycetota bacterium]MDA1177579.1 hypothetical protein [Planctomycetota bacterium]